MKEKLLEVIGKIKTIDAGSIIKSSAVVLGTVVGTVIGVYLMSQGESTLENKYESTIGGETETVDIS